jgi:hypothetical protein
VFPQFVVSSLQRSKAPAKYNGMENVSRCDWACEGCAKNTRRELHAVNKLRRPCHVESSYSNCFRAIFACANVRRIHRRVVNCEQISESALGILPCMGRRGSTATDRRAYLQSRPMAYPKSLRLLIQGRLESGVLPRNGLHRVSGGPGKGESCFACSEIIAETQFAMEGTGEHRTVLQFHVGCFSLWNIERTGLAGAESGASANGL